MAPPLAGKPPFATDENDSVFASGKAAQQRQVRRPPPQVDDRTSAYDVYDNYLSPPETKDNRNSGIEGLGMGFMNAMADDDDSDSDDEEDMRRARMASTPRTPTSKHAALAAATGVSSSPVSKAPTPERRTVSPQQQQARTSPAPRPRPSPPPGPTIAAPRPGYAAPIAALNRMDRMGNSISPPAPAAAPAGRVINANGLRINPGPPGSPSTRNGAPSPTGSPHPLGAPVTPITPVFARPQRTNTMDSGNTSLAFSETKGLIMRGDREETPFARERGEKGEQFWRRFSMVAKDPQEKGQSAWLKKYEGGARSHKRWIWIVGIILIICAAGGIGIGVYMSEEATAHYRPSSLGGSANEGTNATSVATAAGKTTAKGSLKTSSDLHVSPTNTVQRREPLPLITVGPAHARRNRRMARMEAEEAL